MAGTTGVTVLMADMGLEDCGALEVNRLLEASGVITTLAPQELSLHRFVDPAGTPCVSISYVVAGEDDEFFVDGPPALQLYVGDEGSSQSAG